MATPANRWHPGSCHRRASTCELWSLEAACACTHRWARYCCWQFSVGAPTSQFCWHNTVATVLQLVTVFREGKHWVLQGVLAPRSPEDDGKCPDLHGDQALFSDSRLQSACKTVCHTACR